MKKIFFKINERVFYIMLTRKLQTYNMKSKNDKNRIIIIKIKNIQNTQSCTVLRLK